MAATCIWSAGPVAEAPEASCGFECLRSHLPGMALRRKEHETGRAGGTSEASASRSAKHSRPAPGVKVKLALSRPYAAKGVHLDRSYCLRMD